MFNPTADAQDIIESREHVESHLNWLDSLHNCLIMQQFNYDPKNEESTAHELTSPLNGTL
jgi:hypothetical protein